MEGRRAPRPCALTILHPSGPSGGPSTDWESLVPGPVPEALLKWADTHMHIHVGGQTDMVTHTQMCPQTHMETWTRVHTPPTDTHGDVDTRSHAARRHTRRRGHVLTRRPQTHTETWTRAHTPPLVQWASSPRAEAQPCITPAVVPSLQIDQSSLITAF